MSLFANLDALYPIAPVELSRQWALTQHKHALPEEWRRRSLAGWHLAAHPDANVCRLQSLDGEDIGWVIEPLAYLEGGTGFVTDESLVTLPVEGDFTPTDIERALYGRDANGHTNGSGFVGNWTAIVLSSSGRCQRLYLGVTHSVVYSADAGIAATTHNLVPDLKRDVELSRAVDPVNTNAYYTFGLTPFIGLQRLLPNHYLDLSSFEERRHWPITTLGDHIAGPEAAAQIVDHARDVLNVLAEHYNTFNIPLSAGRDSRAVLACVRPFANDTRVAISSFTSSRPSLEFKIDVQIAIRLARTAKIQHRVDQIVPQPTEQADIAHAFVRLGESKYGPILTAPAREKTKPPADQISLPGMAGETARAYYWSDKRPVAADIEPAALVKRMDSPLTGRILAAATRWVEALPEAIRNSPSDTLDLAYIEQRMGCWDSSTRYLFPGRGRANLSLMATALSLEAMLRLPENYRASGALQSDMVAYGWPELLPLPFNTPIGMLRLRQQVRRVRAIPQRGRAAIKKRLLRSGQTA